MHRVGTVQCRSSKRFWTRVMLVASIGATVATSALAAYGFGVEPFWLEITRPIIRIPDLPTQLDGLVLAHLSDFHVSSTVEHRSAVRQAIDACNLARPDAVILTGDYAVSREAVPAFASLLREIESRPAFAVMGNHDCRFGPGHYRGVVEALQNAGITLLDNRSTTIDCRGQKVWLVGIGDGFTGHDRLDVAVRDVSANDHPRILLTHYPDVLLGRVPMTFDLALSGHSHGAQINLPLITGRALRQSDTQFVGGLYCVAGTPVYVNRGLGTSGYRIRIRARPELALITLRRA
jgi:predicted MPP superfamily phosphohydrolase